MQIEGLVAVITGGGSGLGEATARALHADHLIGNIAPGMEADLVVVTLDSTPAIAQATRRAEDIWQALFPTIMMGDDRAIRATWVAGACVHGA